MHMFNAADSWALSCMTWHQTTICVPDLPVMATYQNNDLPLFNYSMLTLPLSTTQVNNKTGLFGDPEDTQYTVTFQPFLKSCHNALFPEAGFPHKHLIGFKVMLASTSAHLKSHQLSVLILSLAKYNMHGQLLLSPCITHMPKNREFPSFFSQYLLSICCWWFHKTTCNKLLRNTAVAVNHCMQMNKGCIQLSIRKVSKIFCTVKGDVEAINISECG